MGLKIQPKRFGNKIATLVAVFALMVQPVYAVVVSQIASAAAYGDVIVRAANAQGWNQQNMASGGTTSFVTDAAAPYGNGALQLTTTSNTASKAQRGKNVAINLSDLTTLSYWTKQVAGAPEAAPSIQLTVKNLNGVSSSSTANLVFEPYWNVSGAAGTSHALPNGTWQQWDAKAGLFWSTKTYASAGLTNGAGGPPFYTLAQVLATNPNAQITNIAVNIGTYNTNYVVLADGVNVNGTVYDFEPVAPVPPATPANLRLNGDKACGYITNVNWITPTWDAVSGAVSYNYRVTLPGGGTYGPTNVGNVTSVSGVFGGEGLSTFSVQAVGADGLTSDWATPCAVTYDATAPDAPSSLSWKTDTNVVVPNDGKTNVYGGTASWQDSSSDIDHYVYKYWNDIAGNPYKVGSEYVTTTTATNLPGVFNQGDGVHHFCVAAVDYAGNTSACTQFTLLYDGTAPTVAFTGSTPAAGDYVKGIVTVQTIVSDVYANAYNLRVEGGVSLGLDYKNPFVSGATNSYAWNTATGAKAVADGSRTLLATATDTAGNKTTITRNIIVDNTKPVVSFTAPSTGSYNPTSITLAATDNIALKLATANIYDETNTVLKKSCSKSVTPALATSYILNCPISGLADGVYTIRANASDMAGNIASTLTRTFTIDVSGPTVTIPTYTTLNNVITPQVNANDSNSPLSYSWVQLSGPTTGVTIADPSAAQPGITVTETGSYVFELTVKDPAGNQTVRTFSFSYTAPATPAVTPVTPIVPVVTLVNQTPTTGDGFTNVAVAVAAPAADDTDEQGETNASVQGASDTKDGKVLAATAVPEVKGASDTFFGLAWYWWLPIITAIIGFGWWLIAAWRRRRQEDEA